MSGANGGPVARAVADPVRRRLAAAAISLIGSYGYAQASVEMICERARARRSQFDRCFAGKEDCFLTVHDEVAGELCDAVAAAEGNASSWHDRLWATGWAATRFLQEDPIRARFLVVEVNGAGAGALQRRDRVLQRLAEIVDGGRAEAGDGHRSSRATAEIVAGAIYGTVAGRVEAGWPESGRDFLPELVYMAVMPYLGAEAAEAELAVQSLR